MKIYLLNIILLLAGYFVLVYSDRFRKGKLIFCIQASLQWIVLSGFRSVEVGADTGRYKVMFEQVKNTSWDMCFLQFKDWFFGGEGKDPGYTLLQKVFQLFSNEYQVFLVFIAIIFVVPMSIWIYKNSENVLLSYVIFSCLFYSFFAITGIRQTIVTGVMVFLGDFILKKRKYILFFILLVLLIPIHKSVITVAIIPIVRSIKVDLKNSMFWIIGIILAYFFRDELMSLLSGIVGYSQYDKFYEGAGASTFAFLYYGVCIVSVIFYQFLTAEANENVTISFNMVMVGAILLPLTFINQSAMRAVQYFSVYLMVLIPYLLDAFSDDKERTVLNIVIVAALVVLLVRNNPNYTFFWQV